MSRALILKRVCFTVFFCNAIVIVTRIASQFGTIANATTVGFSFLILVILSAVLAGLTSAVVTSIFATLCYNYFFLPPFDTFNISDFENWVALFTFLLTAIVISRLTSSAHENSHRYARLDQAVRRMQEFGSWLLSTPCEQITLSVIATEAARIFSLEYCSIHVYTEGKWYHFSGTAFGKISRQIEESLTQLEDHPTSLMELIDEQALGVRYTHIRRGSETLALFVVRTDSLPANAIGTIAGMIGVRLMEILEDRSPLNFEMRT